MDKPVAFIIEDDRDISALFGHVLDVAGYQTETVYDGKEAAQRLKTERPDIVLLDLNLPGMPGGKILEHMHEDERLRGVPVVVITGHTQVAEHLPVKPDLVLLKPVNLDQLSNLIERLRTTPTSSSETPWDETTHLYNRSFFATRLSYALERSKQIEANQFAIMFVDLEPFFPGEQILVGEKLNEVLHQLAPYLKTGLRPTDTIARVKATSFLILIEDVLDDKVPSDIAARLRYELGEYLQQMRGSVRIYAYVGSILCDGGYESPQKIMQDIDIARKLARKEKQYTQYNRESLMALRNSVQSDT